MFVVCICYPSVGRAAAEQPGICMMTRLWAWPRCCGRMGIAGSQLQWLQWHSVNTILSCCHTVMLSQDPGTRCDYVTICWETWLCDSWLLVAAPTSGLQRAECGRV